MISLSTDEVERRFQLLQIPNRFSDQEKYELSTTTIVTEERDVFIFPVPQNNIGLNILMLRRLIGTDPTKPPSFFDHPWYLDEPFALQDCEPGWHCLYSNVLPDSLSKPLNYVDSLKEVGMDLPSAIEVTVMLFLHYAGTGEQLLSKKHTWCRDKATMDRFVTVGAFGRNGLFVSAHPQQFTSRGLGVCAKIRR